MVKLPGKPLTPERVQALERQMRELSATTSGRVRTAQTTAVFARTKAFEAKDAAVEARGIADTASETAGEASQVAGTASTTAVEAKAAVETLGTDFTERMATAAQNLTDAKTSLQADADAAAAIARAAADLAATKGENITQPSAPTGSRANPANLWIDNSTNAAGVPKNQPNRYGPYTVPDPNAAALILPAASAQTETEVMRISVAPGASTPVALTLSISMQLNSLVKSSIARLRDGLTGAVLASYVFSDKGDSTTGNQETWTLPAGFTATPSASVLVLTIQSNNANAPAVYSLHRTITASTWQPVTDALAIAAAQDAATAAAAAKAAKTVADQATTAAAVAQQTATDANTAALTAAGIANAKGKVIPQVSKPTGANAAAGNLWIRLTDNTPWIYDPSIPDWVQVTDKAATDAAAAAATANQAAVAASNAAKAAQATADGRPQTLWSTTAGPSGTAPPGSTWFLWDASKNVAGQWLQSGTLAAPVWTPQQIRSEVIANLDVAKLIAGSAAIATLVAQKIAAATGNFQTANVSNLFVTSGATMSQAVIDFLFANVVQAKKITAGMIDVDTLNGITLNGVRVSGSTLSTVPTTDGSNRYILISQESMILNGREGSSEVYGLVQLTPSGNLQLLRRNIDNTSSSLQVGSGTAGSLTSNGRWDASASTAYFVSLFFSSLANTTGSFAVGGSGSLLAGACTLGAVVVGSNIGGFAVALRTSTSSFSVTNTGVVKAADFQTADGTSIVPADTGWINVTPTNGWANQGATKLRYRVKAGVFYLQGYLSSAGATATTFATIPSNYTPSQDIRVPATNGTGSSGTWMDFPVGSNGTLAANTARNPNFAVSWPLDQ